MPVHLYGQPAEMDQILTIARKHDCQTCFLCEAYCPVDALYVAPQVEEPVEVDELEQGPTVMMRKQDRDRERRGDREGGREGRPGGDRPRREREEEIA